MEEKDFQEKDRVTQYLLDELNGLKEQLADSERKIGKLKKLSDVTTIISSTLNKKEILKRILRQTKEFMNCEKSSILLIDPHENKLKFEVLTEDSEMDDLKDIRLEMGEGIAGKVWETGRSILIEDSDKDSLFTAKINDRIKDWTKSLIAAPLIMKGNIIGVMEALNKNDGESFNDFDKEIFESLALHAAIAIENAELYMAGISDKMTGLFNHEYFMNQMEREYQRSKRYGHSLSLIMLDIDHFKNFNDTYGHQLGDQVIIKIAGFLKKSCRKDLDSPCRYGGEEFALILPDTGKDGALLFCERIRKSIGEMTISHKGEDIPVTVSAGVSNLEDLKPDNRDEMIRMADAALYDSKKNGRNRVSYYSPTT